MLYSYLIISSSGKGTVNDYSLANPLAGFGCLALPGKFKILLIDGNKNERFIAQ